MFEVHFQWPLIEVLLSPKDTVQIIIGFISAGAAYFPNELMLCNCPSGTFFFFIFHSYSFTTAGFKSFLLLFVPSAQWSKQQDWSYTAFWYCSKCSSIDMGWECTDWKKRAKIEIRFLFFEPFSVQQNVSNLKAATLAAYRHANESWSDEFCINSWNVLQTNSKQEKHRDTKKLNTVYIFNFILNSIVQIVKLSATYGIT